MVAGVLALQGCVQQHLKMLQKLGVEAITVRSEDELKKVSRIILPGGESTTMIKLLLLTDLFKALKEFVASKPTWGVCAGAILLAKEVANPSQLSLEAINIRAERNHYGSQQHSFKGVIMPSGFEADFIRAPLLTPISSSVEVLGSYKDQPVWLKEKNIIVSSFHTELGDNTTAHEKFLSL